MFLTKKLFETQHPKQVRSYHTFYYASFVMDCKMREFNSGAYLLELFY